MIHFLKKQSPGRLITMGFAAVILLGALLLMLPCAANEGVKVNFIDALFTSTRDVYKRQEHGQAVFPARYPDGDFIPVFNHLVVIHGLSGVT